MFLEKQKIIEEIILNSSFRELCKKICKGNDLHNDLYQEFILQLYELKNDELLISAKSGNYLSVYCVGIINNLWNNRHRLKTYKNGKTSSLTHLTNYFMEVPSNLVYSKKDTDFIHEIKQELNNMLFSSDEKIRKNASALYKSVYVYKNIHQHSMHTGVYDNKIRRSCTTASRLIKEKIKNNNK